MHGELHTRMFTAALFVITQIWKEFIYPKGVLEINYGSSKKKVIRTIYADSRSTKIYKVKNCKLQNNS